MSFLNNILKGFLGDKNANDLKEVKKVVTKIKAAEPAIQQLSDDGLREKTAEFKTKIKAASANVTSEIEQLNEKITTSTNIDEKESFFSRIEVLKKKPTILKRKCLTKFFLKLLP